MNGFTLQKHKSAGKEETAVVTYCALNRIPFRVFSAKDPIPDGFIPVGSVEWCEKSLPKTVTTPDYYPDFLQGYLHRKVWRTDKWPLGQKVFIKPSDQHKRFTGFCTSGTYRKKKKGPYWCSEIVSFTNEWRYYVADGKILTGEWYWGDDVNTPDAPALDVTIPAGFCGALDFGALATGELALVEAHPPYACGWYGVNHKLYVEWVIRGWAYLITPQV